MKFLPDEESFDLLASGTAELASTPASARLRSKVYSALVREQQRSGPLLGLHETKATGGDLCVFENLVQILPVGERGQSFNCCSVCHARLAAERLEKAPIYWGGCPYVAFQHR